jgi:hypothetical protein
MDTKRHLTVMLISRIAAGIRLGQACTRSLPLTPNLDQQHPTTDP